MRALFENLLIERDCSRDFSILLRGNRLLHQVKGALMPLSQRESERQQNTTRRPQ